MNDCTHHSTVSAEIRTLLNSCDLGGFNKEFFIKATFVSDLAIFVQNMETAAYRRGQQSLAKLI